MNIVFDLDGVLADTRALVEESYRHVGIEMPSDAWGVPWREWLPPLVTDRDPDDVHDAKNRYYLRNLSAVKPLSGLEALRHLRAIGHRVQVLTCASHDAASTVLMRLGVANTMFTTVRASSHKADVLKRQLGGGVYVDDMDVETPVGWRLVRYDPAWSCEEVVRRVARAAAR